ncbi:MAG: 23S rRNA (pseudouridine(1915)-N(3))-methyltransferase RlmH, partial [Pseudomonadota bacterium]
ETASQRAGLRLCLSRLTLTHEISRLVLLEQIYRAARIIAGHPYHK